MFKRLLILGLICFAATLAGALTAPHSSKSADTGPPTVLPDISSGSLPVVDEHGQPVTCPNGRVLQVTHDQLSPPTGPGVSVGRGVIFDAQNGGKGEQVTPKLHHWSCGVNGRAVLAP